jgi:Xaa-Pro aminopeptidase
MNLPAIRKKLTQETLDALLVTSVPNIIYLTGYSGFSSDEREGFVLLTKKTNYIFTDGRYTTAIKEQVKGFELLEIFSNRRFKDLLKDLARELKLKKIGFESTNITVAEYTALSKSVVDSRLVPTTNIIESFRLIKTADEITTIERACNLGDKAFEYVLKKIKKGISEKEVAFELDTFVKKNGADMSFRTIVAFGKNAAVPHHMTSETKLEIGDFVLLDFGVKVDNYCSDMTRTVVFGKASPEQKKMYQTVLQAQTHAIKRLSSSPILSRNIDKAARDYIVSQKYPSIPHSVGHGIGLEVHEIPRVSPHSNEKLKPAMVFSVEPGIYIPDSGGVRIEDLVVLEKKAPRLLTHAPKNKLIEL